MNIISHPRGGVGRTLLAALASASAQPSIIDTHVKDAAQAITVRDDPMPIAYGGRAGGGKTHKRGWSRHQRKAMAKARGKELMDTNAVQLDVRCIHPRWLRRVVSEMLNEAEVSNVPAQISEADIARWRAMGQAATLLEVLGE